MTFSLSAGRFQVAPSARSAAGQAKRSEEDGHNP